MVLLTYQLRAVAKLTEDAYHFRDIEMGLLHQWVECETEIENGEQWDR